jgi:ubiquinone/menaquinone biosynthesis C-methylase UbiE
MNQLSDLMKRDWDARAQENARWYINTVRVRQSESEFDETGRAEVARLIASELGFLTQGRAPQSLRLLEIGCGIGRMTRHLAALFGEVYAVDVSGEMIRQARERLGACANVRWLETNGCDLRELPDAHFDLVFSAFVFQHVPSAEVIRGNIAEAYRVLKAGGICKFGVNSTDAATFQQRAHDTWTGAALPENELRGLMRQLGAQLLRIFDAGTQYCWVTLRKPIRPFLTAANAPPRIVAFGRSDDLRMKELPLTGDQAWLGLLVAGLEREGADANSLAVEIGGACVQPRYVGPANFDWANELTQIEAAVPQGLRQGETSARLLLAEGAASERVTVKFCAPAPRTPEIVTVRNASDYGTDLWTRGAKAWLMLYVKYLPETASVDNVRLQIGERVVEPSYVGADARFGGHQVNVLVPAGTVAGQTELHLLFEGVCSPAVELRLEEPEE